MRHTIGHSWVTEEAVRLNLNKEVLVILYGSEIWGRTPNYKKHAIFFFSINRRATDLSVIVETRRYSFVFEIIVNMLKYYERLCTSDDILLRKAYKESSAAHDQDKVSWIGCVKTILKFLDLDIFALSKAKF